MCFQHMFSGSSAASGHEREEVSVRAQLSGDATLGMLQRHQSPLAVPEAVGVAGSGSHDSKPPSPTQTSKLVELLLGWGKDGLSKGSWRLLLKGLFLFLLPICKKGPRQASAACLPGVWPCLSQRPIPVLSSLPQGQSWELPSRDLNSTRLPQK